MKRVPLALLLIGGALGLVPAARAQVCPTCPSYEKTGSAAVKSLAALAGCWTGKGPNGLETKAFYELGSDGTALLEVLWVEDNPTMYTVYSLDGETPVAQHFCSYGNQIHMRAQPSEDPNVLNFAYHHANNLPSEHDNHMTYVKFNFRGQDRLDLEWGLLRDGKHEPQPFVFRRVTKGCETRSTPDW